MRLAAIPVAAALALGACGGGDSGAGSGTASAATTSGAARAAAAGGVRLAAVGTFDTPVYVTAPAGERRRIFVVEQGGTIRVVRAGKKVARPFLDIRSKVVAGGEQGLLSMAFAPDYARTRRFYVDYTDRSGVQRVVEYRRSASHAERASPASARLVLSYDPYESNHNGGLVTFGPDGLLYVGTGDGGGANDQHGERGNAQDLGRLEGKLLRIDPRRAPGRRATRSSAAPARAPRSTATACATRGASRSTARPATSRSATSARTRSRRSTSRARTRHAASTTAGARSRAGGATTGSRRRTPSRRCSS
jgi:glucose/arabinose dehydrogenase